MPGGGGGGVSRLTVQERHPAIWGRLVWTSSWQRPWGAPSGEPFEEALLPRPQDGECWASFYWLGRTHSQEPGRVCRTHGEWAWPKPSFIFRPEHCRARPVRLVGGAQTKGVAAGRVCSSLAFLIFAVGAFEFKVSYCGGSLFLFASVFFCPKRIRAFTPYKLCCDAGPPSFPLSSAPQWIYCSRDASNSWHRFLEHIVKHMVHFVMPSSCNHLFVETSSQTIVWNWSPTCLLNSGSSTVFNGIFRAACARCHLCPMIWRNLQVFRK